MNTPTTFHPLARLLHWTMATMIVAMLFIGAGMVATVSQKHGWLLAIHKPLASRCACAIVPRRCRRIFRSGNGSRRWPRTGCCTR